jgi:hypothetical protein
MSIEVVLQAIEAAAVVTGVGWAPGCAGRFPARDDDAPSRRGSGSIVSSNRG